MTLYTRSFPLPLCCRVLDAFLSEGVKVVHRVSLALLAGLEAELLAGDMGHVMVTIRSLPSRCQALGAEDEIMAQAFAINLKRADIEAATPPAP
jgi:ecotropic viral integration site 5 protein